jgi:hypothetical protein
VSSIIRFLNEPAPPYRFTIAIISGVYRSPARLTPRTRSSISFRSSGVRFTLRKDRARAPCLPSQFHAEKIVLLQHHIVPFGAGARENNLRKGIARLGMSSPFARQRGILCGYFIVVLTLPPKSKAREANILGLRGFLSKLSYLLF